MRREQPREGGRREGAAVVFLAPRAGRKCGDRKFSSGRIIDRAKDIYKARYVWSDKLCGVCDRSIDNDDDDDYKRG